MKVILSRSLRPRAVPVNLAHDRRDALRAAATGGDPRAVDEYLNAKVTISCIRNRLKWLAYLGG